MIGTWFFNHSNMVQVQPSRARAGEHILTLVFISLRRAWHATRQGKAMVGLHPDRPNLSLSAGSDVHLVN